MDISFLIYKLLELRKRAPSLCENKYKQILSSILKCLEDIKVNLKTNDYLLEEQIPGTLKIEENVSTSNDDG